MNFYIVLELEDNQQIIKEREREKMLSQRRNVMRNTYLSIRELLGQN